MVITLYKNLSDDKTANKTLVDPITKNVTRKDSWSIESPSFTVSLTDDDAILLGYNYCYIETFKRFYFCRVTLANGGLAVISCNVDPLASHRDAIRGLVCMVERNEFDFNPYFDDPLVPISQGTIIDTIKGATVSTTGDARALYLTCVGGIEATE